MSQKMAHGFQNAESIKEALFAELQNILSPDTLVRTPAEMRMKQLEFTEGYGVYLSEIIMNQAYELAMRQLACIMLTRYVEEHWSETELAKPAIAPEQAKRTIRNILPNGLYDPNSKIRSAVAHTISTIAASDWPGEWSELFDIITKCLGGNEDSIHGAIQVLLELSHDEKSIKELGPIIISEIYRIFEAEQLYSVKTRAGAIKILKPLFMSISCCISNKAEQTAMMNSVLSTFMGKLIHNMSISSGSNANFHLKIEIIKILSFLVTDLSSYIQPFMDQILHPIWQLLTQTADIYVKVNVNETQSNPFDSKGDDDDENATFTTMIIQILEFIQCVIGTVKLRSVIKNVMTDLVYITIVYIQVCEEQIEGWKDDIEKFVDDDDDWGVELTVRHSAHDVLIAIEDYFGAKALPALSEALHRHLNVAEAEKTAGNQFFWKIHEASMVAVNTFAEVILDSEDKFDLSNYLNLVRNLMNYQASPYFLGKCLCTLSLYSRSKLFNPQMLEQILEVTLNSLSSDKPTLLKISAVRAINRYTENLQTTDDTRRHLILSKLSGFVEGMVDLFAHYKNSVLALLMETLTKIVSFDNNFAATVHTKVIPLTIAIFLKCSGDPYILELVQDMLKVLSQNPLCLQPLQEKIIPTLVSILNLQGEHRNPSDQDIALDVLTTIVKYSQPPLSEGLIENAFPAAVHCVLRSDDHSVLLSGGECLRAFISVSPEQVCAYKNGEGLNYIMQVTTMLLNPMNSEHTAGQIGRLVITIITKLGNLLGDNIDLLLKAVISKMQLVHSLRVSMSLVIIFAYLFLTQMEAVLNFLNTVPGPTGEPAMQFVFSNWLPRQNLFYGVYERKVATMALCRIFEYGVTVQDNRLTSLTIKEAQTATAPTNKVMTRSQSAGAQNWVTVPVLVKIFKILINELEHLRELKQADEDDNSWSDDDDGDEVDKAKDVATGDGTEKSPPKSRYVSDLLLTDEEDEDAADDQLMQELMKDPIFQANIDETLIKFLCNFSTNEHFSTFVSQLTETEKRILRNIQIEVA